MEFVFNLKIIVIFNGIHVNQIVQVIIIKIIVKKIVF